MQASFRAVAAVLTTALLGLGLIACGGGSKHANPSAEAAGTVLDDVPPPVRPRSPPSASTVTPARGTSRDRSLGFRPNTGRSPRTSRTSCSTAECSRCSMCAATAASSCGSAATPRRTRSMTRAARAAAVDIRGDADVHRPDGEHRPADGPASDPRSQPRHRLTAARRKLGEGRRGIVPPAQHHRFRDRRTSRTSTTRPSGCTRPAASSSQAERSRPDITPEDYARISTSTRTSSARPCRTCRSTPRHSPIRSRTSAGSPP